MSYLRLNSRGSILVYVMGLVVVISVITGGIFYNLTRLNNRSEGVVFDGATLSLIAEQVSSVTENEASWYKTVVNDANLNCLLVNGGNCSSAYQPLTLYLPDNTIFTQNSGSLGFDRYGFRCSNYSSTVPDSKCVYKVKLFWKCDSGSCVSVKAPTDLIAKSPKIKIKIEYVFNSSTDLNSGEKNLNHKDLDFERGGNQKGLKAFCESISAEMHAGGLHCRFNPPSAENCRSLHSRHMVKKLKGGHVECENPTTFGDGTFPFKCNSGSAMTGFFNDHPICDVF